MAARFIYLGEGGARDVPPDFSLRAIRRKAASRREEVAMARARWSGVSGMDVSLLEDGSVRPFRRMAPERRRGDGKPKLTATHSTPPPGREAWP